MKRYAIVVILLIVMTLGSKGQFYPGNPQWKWDTVVLYNTTNQPTYLYSQVLDAGGNVLQQLVEKRNNNAWVNYLKIDIGYENGRMKTATNTAWVGGVWQDVTRITAAYDFAGRVIAELIEQYKNGGWSNYRLRHYAYTQQNQKLQMMQEKWSNGSWENDLKTDYAYDNDGHLESVISQFSETGEDWINGMKLAYTCDASGNYLEALASSFETGEWIAGNKIIYTNDARGNILSETYATLTGSAWVNEFRRIFTYDENNNNLTGKNELFASMTWNPEMSSAYIYYGKEYLLLVDENYRFEASYKHFPLGLFEIPVSKLNIYPNPASTSFNMGDTDAGSRYDEIGIYSLNGKLIKKVTFPSLMDINVTDIENGAYLIRAISDKGNGTGKIIISH